jgi:hypothetical protein
VNTLEVILIAFLAGMAGRFAVDLLCRVFRRK